VPERMAAQTAARCHSDANEVRRPDAPGKV